MTTLTFDWSRFKQDGLLFQHLCRELFEAEGLYVEERMEGGSDRGRDLEVFLARDHKFDGSRQPDWWIECKSRVTQTIDPSDVSVNLAYAIIHHAKRLVFMTNSHLTNPARDIIRDFTRCTTHYFSTMTLQREDLEAWIAANPDIYDDYFVKTPSEPRRPRPPRSVGQAGSKPIDIDYWITSTFRDDDPRLVARARNFSFTEQELRVDFGDTHQTLRLEPFAETECEIQVSSAATLQPSFVVGGRIVDAQPRHRFNQLARRIDAVFVDPNEDLQRIEAAIATRQHVYVSGPAGLGKTRLIREVARANNGSITIDLSTESYGHSLASRLIAHALGIEIPVLAYLTASAIESMLLRQGCNQQASRLLAAFIKKQSTDIEPEATTTAIADLFEPRAGNGVIFVDNIHNFSAFDLVLFRRLLQNRSFVIICTARNNEFVLMDAAATLHELVESGEMAGIELSPLDLQVRLSAFVKAAACDGDTATFLRKYSRMSASFHSLLLQLKQLRLLKMIGQDADGRFVLERPSTNAPPYRRVWDELLANLSKAYESERVERVLQLASTWGYAFPDRLLIDVLGASTADLIDRLVGDEIFVQTGTRIPNVVSLRFDHELTHEIVYGAMGLTPERRMSFARQCVNFLIHEGKSSRLYDPKLLSLQYERTLDLPSATVHSNEAALRLITEGQIADASRQFAHSVDLLDRLDEDGGIHEPALHTATLLQFIKTGAEVRGIAVVLPRMKQLATHLVAHPDNLAQAALQEHFARYYTDQRQEQKALATIDSALATYRSGGDLTAYGRALNTKGVMKKRFAHAPVETLCVHRDAVRILRMAGDRRGEAEALGDLGAVLLENARAHKTLFWWRRSMQRLQGTLDYPAFCSHLTDYAYICALYKPDQPETETHLEAAHALAKRLGLTHLTCRTSINLANYLMFHRVSAASGRSDHLLADALRIARDEEDTYLEMLALFSRIVLDRLLSHGTPPEVASRFFELVPEECTPEWQALRSTDNRLIHIGRYLAIHDRSRIPIAVIANPDLLPFLSLDSVDAADRFEKANRYYRTGGLYATYY